MVKIGLERRDMQEEITVEALLDCYDSMLKVLSKELTLVLSDTRELNRVPNTK